MCVYVGGTPNGGRISGKERVIFTRLFSPFFFSSHFFSTVFIHFSWHCLGDFIEGGRKTESWARRRGKKDSLVVQSVKNVPAMQETWVQFLGWEDPLEKEMATHSSILAWEIPWTEEPGRLKSMGSKESDVT